MPRYIDCLEACNKIDNSNLFTDEITKQVKEFLMQIPIAKVKEIRKSSWRELDENVFECAECGYQWHTKLEDGTFNDVSNFCPQCASEMTGIAEDLSEDLFIFGV